MTPLLPIARPVLEPPPICADDEAALRRAWHGEIARELHDGAIQRLTVAALLLDTLALDIGEHSALAEGRRAVRDAAAQLRALLVADAPAPLPVTALPEELTRMAAGVAPSATVDVAIAPGVRLAVQPHALLVRRTAQELLANVTRHADGRLRHLIVHGRGSEILLEVADDGPGGCPATSPDGHFGLRSVREDIESLGGTVAIRSGPTGTTVTVRLPI